MINTGINAIIGLQLKKITPNQKLLSTSLIIGIIIPDIDLIIDYLLSLFIGFNFLYDPQLSNTLFHSLFAIPVLGLLILIYLEYKNKNNISIVIGLSIGMSLHILLDILTLKSVGIFYPLFNTDLNLNLNDYLNIQIPNKYINILYAFDFLFFRLYTWMIINIIINNKNDQFQILKKISLWMKIQLYIFLLFLFLIYFDVSKDMFAYLFGLAYTLSLAMMLYMTYKTRKIIN
tara:strand:+ start:4759 stop:5454 length:696 start_codon:yes stop_codon:yes gene_type:complete